MCAARLHWAEPALQRHVALPGHAQHAPCLARYTRRRQCACCHRLGQSARGGSSCPARFGHERHVCKQWASGERGWVCHVQLSPGRTWLLGFCPARPLRCWQGWASGLSGPSDQPRIVFPYTGHEMLASGPSATDNGHAKSRFVGAAVLPATRVIFRLKWSVARCDWPLRRMIADTAYLPCSRGYCEKAQAGSGCSREG